MIVEDVNMATLSGCPAFIDRARVARARRCRDAVTQLTRAAVRGILLVLGLLLFSGVLSCKSPDNEQQWVNEIEWVREGLRFVSRDLEAAQEHIPFTIVLPSYLPDGVDRQPWIEGAFLDAYPELQDLYPKDSAEVIVVYHNAESDVRVAIMVTEKNIRVEPPRPGSDSRYAYVTVGECQVVEHEFVLPGADQHSELSGFTFWWRQADVSFKAKVLSYDHDEAIKVIESMIEQQAAE
jgi:hypothetical protein